MAQTPNLARLIGAACLAAAATAQPQNQSEGQSEQAADTRPDARLDPILTDISADENMRDRLVRSAGTPAIAPATPPLVVQAVPNQPADPTRFALADGASAWAEARTLRPEGTFLVGYIGEVARLRTGGLAFLPAAQPGAQRPEPPMVLLPCRTTARLESLLGDQDRGLWVALTGEVQVYHRRNWLLPTAFAGANAPDPTAPRQPEDNARTAPPDEPQPEEGAEIDPVEALIRDLEAERSRRRGIDTTFIAGAEEAEGAATPGARVDGRMLMARRGRMVRSSGGGWVVALDNDTDAPPAPDDLPGRLRLLPCLLVEQMERMAESQGERWVFEVSGHLYRRGSEIYLLPRMFVSLPDDEVKPLQ